MSLAQLGGQDLSRSFLSLVELGKSRISVRALAIVADRLDLPITYFLTDTLEARTMGAELAVDRAEAALADQKPQEALQILDKQGVPDALRPRALCCKGRAFTDLDRSQDAVSALQEALTLIDRGTDRYLRLQVLYYLGAALYASGTYDESLMYLRRAWDATPEEFDDPILLGKITIYIGHILYIRNDIEGALRHYARARDLFKSFGDLKSLACVYSGMSLAYEQQGDLTNALHYSKLSLGAFEANRNARQAASELNNLAVKYQQVGELEQASTCARDAVTRARDFNFPDVEALAHSTLATLALLQENLADAVAEATLADQLIDDDASRAQVAASTVLAEVAERTGDHTRADELYQRLLDVLERTDQRLVFAEKALAYCLLLRHRGDNDRALVYALRAAQAHATRTG